MEIKQSTSLTDSPVYDYYKKGLQSKHEYYVDLGYSEGLTTAILNFDESLCNVVWAEQDGKPKGCICYSLELVNKKVMVVYIMISDNKRAFNKMYKYFEEYAKSLGCILINEIVTMKDTKRMSALEDLGYRKDFYLLYKKV